MHRVAMLTVEAAAAPDGEPEATAEDAPEEPVGSVTISCSAGAASTTLETIDPGTYTYLCTVVGHQNMRGTLTVG